MSAAAQAFLCPAHHLFLEAVSDWQLVSSDCGVSSLAFPTEIGQSA